MKINIFKLYQFIFSDGADIEKQVSGELKVASSPFLEGTGKKINYDLFDIVGQGYAWRSKNNNLVFKSWENKTPETDDAVIVPFLEKFSEIVTQGKDAPMRVMIGADGKTPKVFAKARHSAKTEHMLTGQPYRGCHTQTQIYCNEERRKPFVKQTLI